MGVFPELLLKTLADEVEDPPVLDRLLDLTKGLEIPRRVPNLPEFLGS